MALGSVFAWLPGGLARSVNLVSAVAAAVAVDLVQLLASALAGSAFAGFAAAAALAAGGVYRIFRDRLREAWFVGGELD